MKMKQFRFIFLTLVMAFFFVGHINAQYVEYLNKPLSREGYYADLSIYKNDTVTYLQVKVVSEESKLINKPFMLIKTFKNEVIRLTAESSQIYSNSTDGSLVVGTIRMDSRKESTATFRLSKEVAEKFRDGIYKIRLSLDPITNQDKIFLAENKIGEKLYKLYVDAIKQYDDF